MVVRMHVAPDFATWHEAHPAVNKPYSRLNGYRSGNPTRVI